MATISTRINSSGTYLVNGSFDEITYNRTSPVIKNLLIYTDSFDNAAWGKNAVTILPNTIIAPDGTLTADKIQETAVTTFFAVVQNPTALPSKSYTMSFYAKAGERTQVVVSFTVSTAYVMYNLATGTVTSTSGAYLVGSSITFVGNGWYRCTVSLTSAPSGSNLLYFIIALVNSNSDNYAGTTGFGAYVWGAQIEQNSTVTIYQGIAAASTLVTPTFKNKVTSDAVYVTDIFDEVTFNPLTSGLYIGNSLSYSQDMSQTSVWSYSSGGSGVPPVVTPNAALAPDGTLTANRVFFNSGPVTGTGQSSLNQGNAIPLTIGTSQTFSVWMRVETTATGVNMFNGEAINSLAIDTNWTRYSFPITYSSPVAYGVRIAKREIWGTGGAANVLIWGAQMNPGLTATIHVPTSANAIPISMAAKKETNEGALYVTKEFDEFTGAPVVDSSLLLWIDAGQSTSYLGTGTTWTDLSANQNNGTMTSVTYTNNNFGGLMTFNGTSNVSLAPSKFNTPYTGKTVFVVCRMSSVGWTPGVAQYRGMTGTTDGVSLRNFNFYVFQNGSNQYFLHFSSPGAATLTGALAGLTNDTWFIVAVTNSPTNVTYYLNGQNVYSTSATLSQYNTTTNEFVGRADGTWHGDIAQTMIYSRALTEDEIQQNFNALRRRYGI